MRDYLKAHERELWRWFASARAQADYTASLRLDLLKSAYRLAADSHVELHAAIAEAQNKLGLDVPVTAYQAQDSPALNATLFHIPGEAHLVFSGPVLALLQGDELKSVIGHELAHYHLWAAERGEFHIADQLLQTVAQDPRASAGHEQSARWFQLYTEIFADQGSLAVTEAVEPVIAGLVKIQTGLANVSAASYLKQAEEIFRQTNTPTEGLTHPETFIRARALDLWAKEDPAAHAEIRRMIEGVASVDELDVLGQRRLTQATRRLIGQLLRPKWFQTEAVLGHAKSYFPDFTPDDAADDAASEPAFSEAGLQRYFAFVLLDFAAVDPELEQLPLVAALELSRRLGWEDTFDKLAAKELRLKAREVKKLRESAAEMLAHAEAAP
ncbi:MAG: peptidase m48 ste24p [Limisphaerales bacterium]|nr:MAG: peptidase m48 ste24p [Limisphaerales bacterium]TXT47520.1 MAG: peptidase m48 ste24p [Limisphaerales bacterium]